MEINVIIIRMWSKNLFKCQEEIKLKFFKILNGYENIYRNIFSHFRKIVELDDIR